MFVDPLYQRRNILKLIRHKVLVSSKFELITIHLDELVDFPDYEPIMDDFFLRSLIKIKQRPAEKEVRKIFEELSSTEQEQSEIHVSYEYNFFILDDFDRYYDDIVGGDKFDKYKLSANDIFLKPSSYNSAKGVLSLTPFLDFAISHQGRANDQPRVSTQQCKFVQKLFANKITLDIGLSYTDLPVKDHFNRIDEKKIKKYKNLQTEINKKFTEVTGLKKLILFKEDRFRINPLYLQKD